MIAASGTTWSQSFSSQQADDRRTDCCEGKQDAEAQHPLAKRQVQPHRPLHDSEVASDATEYIL